MCADEMNAASRRGAPFRDLRRRGRRRSRRPAAEVRPQGVPAAAGGACWRICATAGRTAGGAGGAAARRADAPSLRRAGAAQQPRYRERPATSRPRGGRADLAFVDADGRAAAGRDSAPTYGRALRRVGSTWSSTARSAAGSQRYGAAVDGTDAGDFMLDGAPHRGDAELRRDAAWRSARSQETNGRIRRCRKSCSTTTRPAEALGARRRKLAAAVEPTLGPKGMNAMIDRPIGTPIITRDGVSIASEIELFDRFENMGAQVRARGLDADQRGGRRRHHHGHRARQRHDPGRGRAARRAAPSRSTCAAASTSPSR